MSEILRAVLDQSCIYSNPAFYTTEVIYRAASVLPQTSFMEIKADKYFLITSMSACNISTATGGVSFTAFGKYQISLSRSSRRIFTIPYNPGLFAGSERGVFTLPQYILAHPNDILQVEFVPDSLAANRIFSLTFNGIEYGK